MLAKKSSYKPKLRNVIQQACEKKGMKSAIKFKHIGLDHLLIEH
jgi:hypothetical protein